MQVHVDVLEQRTDTLRNPLLASVVAHALLFTSIVLYTNIGERARVLWGDPKSLGGGGGSVGITAVRQLPLPARSGLANPLAADTESRVPLPPKPEPRKAAPAEEPDAIALRGRTRPESRSRYERSQPFRAQPDRTNQLYSSSGQALSSNMYGNPSGASGVGLGYGNAFGHRFGWYRDILERRVAQHWRTDEIDPRIQTAPTVIVTFEILRNGSVRDVRVLQGSGNYALDNSAKRAIFESAPFPELPREFERDNAQIEIWFQLKR